jgi:3-phenylpropionate/trans-cinnamate dioxygenase ferredoxin reductase subunit
VPAADPVVIAGASLAGWATARALRRRGFDGPVCLIGEEDHLPYDRPSLSKQLLTGERTAAELAQVDETTLEQLEIEFLAGVRAEHLDAGAREVRLSTGERRRFRALVIATGASAIRPDLPWLAGVHTLRTMDDALAVRAALLGRPKVVVVGAGFVGMEVASSARSLGLDVTVVEAQPAPLIRGLGAELGQVAGRFARDAGIELLCRTGVASLEGSGRVERVVLQDGRTLEADLVVVGVGARPRTDWLAGSGLRVEDGVLSDEACMADAAGHVFVAGDAARRSDPTTGTHVRVEHWTNALDEGEVVAQNIVDWPRRTAVDAVPYFWSDQFSHKIQMAGTRPSGSQPRVLLGSIDDGPFLVAFVTEDRVHGVVAVDHPRALAMCRRLLCGPATLDEAVALAERLSS